MRCAAVLLLLAAASAFSAAQTTIFEPGFVDERVVSTGDLPIGFTWTPDGRMFVWFKKGQVRVYKDGAFVANFLDIGSRVNWGGDSGLIGFTLDPNFAANGYVYAAYVYEDTPGTNSVEGMHTQRISRFSAAPNGNAADPNSEVILVGKVSKAPCATAGNDCIQTDYGYHTVNHLAFGPDGKLYASIGDGGGNSANDSSFASQDLNILRGKLLRINPNGTAPADNPWYDGTNSNRSKVFSYGHRNPYRFFFDSRGLPSVGNVGWIRYEEFDRGRGKNFGWPCFEGHDVNPEYYDKYAYCRSLAKSSTAGPFLYYGRSEGATVIAGPYNYRNGYPADMKGQMFYADYVGQWIRRVSVDANGWFVSQKTFATNLPGPVYLDFGPDGQLYYASVWTGEIRRIRYTASNTQPPIAKATAAPSSGLSPLNVNFSSAGSTDPDGGTLTYLWDFGDGATSTLTNPSHQYTSTTAKTFTATLTVKDDEGSTNTTSLGITVGNRAPIPVISTPANGTVVRVGQTVNFSGYANDPDEGTLPASALTWTVILHHNTHTHDAATIVGSNGSFNVLEHDPTGTYSYELRLTAKDSFGTTASTAIMLPVEQSSGCALSTVSPSVTICQPGDWATVTSPVRIVAGTTSAQYPVTAMKIYIDYVEKYAINSNKIDVSLSMAAGNRIITVQAWNTGGQVFKDVHRVNVSGGSSTCTASTVNNTMTICQPAEASTVSSPVRVLAVATSSLPITGTHVYVDNVLKYQGTSKNIDASIAMGSGQHFIVVQAWNSAGTLMRATRTITVP